VLGFRHYYHHYQYQEKTTTKDSGAHTGGYTGVQAMEEVMGGRGIRRRGEPRTEDSCSSNEGLSDHEKEWLQ